MVRMHTNLAFLLFCNFLFISSTCIILTIENTKLFIVKNKGKAEKEKKERLVHIKFRKVITSKGEGRRQI